MTAADAANTHALRLNLGCGNKAKPGFIGVDRFHCSAAQVVATLTGRLPFADSSVDAIWADNVIEHIPDLPALMAELHRVCRDGARITLITPHFTSLSSWRDPTHVHHLSYFSLDHFLKPAVAHYMGGGFAMAEKRLSFGGGIGLLGRLVFAISPAWYEEKWCFVLRASTLRFDLTVVKTPEKSGGTTL